LRRRDHPPGNRSDHRAALTDHQHLGVDPAAGSTVRRRHNVGSGLYNFPGVRDAGAMARRCRIEDRRAPRRSA
jgi:hypothetical protein